MATLTGLIPVTVGTFGGGGGWGGIPLGGEGEGGGGGAGNAERRTIYWGYIGIMENKLETTILYGFRSVKMTLSSFWLAKWKLGSEPQSPTRAGPWAKKPSPAPQKEGSGLNIVVSMLFSIIPKCPHYNPNVTPMGTKGKASSHCTVLQPDRGSWHAASIISYHAFPRI